MATNVLIAGAGPAGLEAALALHRLAGDRVATTLLAPDAELTYRPLSVLSPFAAGEVPAYPLERMAADAGFRHVRGRLAAVAPDAHTVTTDSGERLPYDVLLVATGARPVDAFPRATAFAGSMTDQEQMHGIVQDVEGGYLRRLAFVVPVGTSWPLPLYELALMLGERADLMGVELESHFVTPEPAPLALFGDHAAREVAAMLAEARITLHTASCAEIAAPRQIRLRPSGATLDVDRAITLPHLRGPAIPGLPSDGDGFLVTDAHGRVLGVPDVYAAGDVTAFPIKQGGIACQQADAAAAHIAARAGAPITPEPFEPVLRGMLVTERAARYMRRTGDASEVAGRALWWPPAKIAGRELAGYLQSLDEAFARPSGRPINLAVGDQSTAPIEVLSLN